MTDNTHRRLIAGAFVLFLIASLADTSLAQSQTKTFNVPAQSATTGIPEFARQAGIQILVSEPLVRGKKIAAVVGARSIDEALLILLKGTGLVAMSKDGATYTLAAIPKTTKERTSQDESAAVTLQVAQNPPDTSTNSEDSKGIPEILVKGSRVLNLDVTRTEDDAQPYHIFDSQTIEESGATNVEDFLKNRLSMNSVIETNSQRVGQNGILNNTSTINLRGLGPNNTLILVDGRRMAGVDLGGGVAGQPDINGLPLAAIDRIEVLPSSASAIYGGSAVGGVVNIILKKNYSGGDLRGLYDITADGHAPIRTLSGAYGFGFEEGKSHVMLMAQYSDSKPLVVGDRISVLNRGYDTILANDPTYLGYNPSLPFQRPILGATPNIVGTSNLTLKGSGVSLNSPIATLPVGYSATSDPSTIIGGQWNLAPANVNQQPNGLLTPLGSNPKVESLAATFTREMSDKVELFAESMYSSNRSFQEANVVRGGYRISAAAPFNPFNQTVMITFPDNAATPFDSDSTTYTATGGLKVQLPGHWSGEADYTWSKSNFSYVYNAGFDSSVLGTLLNPFVDTLANPLNISPYSLPDTIESSTNVNDISSRAAGPIAHLPWGDVRLSLGLEHRKESEAGSDASLNYTEPSLSALDSSLMYFPQSQTADSVFAESDIPLVTAKNALPGINSVDLQLAGRFERYSVDAGSNYIQSYPSATPPYYTITPTPSDADANGNGGTTLHRRIDYSSSNYTLALKYKPIDDVIIRGSLATAFLPPSQEQFVPNPIVCTLCDSVNDPKTGTSYLVNTIQGGNPNLKPQHSRNWDLGLIYEPHERVLQGLRINLEFYQITQFDYITTITGNQILSAPGLAGRVTRDPTTGLITQIDETYLNATQFKLEGYDLGLDYQVPTSIGSFDLHAAVTRIDHDEREYTIGVPTVDYAGTALAEGAAVKLQGNATLTWSFRNWGLGWTATYFGPYPQLGSPGDVVFQNPRYDTAQGSDHIPSQIYHDFFARYAVGRAAAESANSSFGSKLAEGWTIQLGIKNVFNKVPPFDAVLGNPFYYSTLGDLRLRDIWLTVKKEIR